MVPEPRRSPTAMGQPVLVWWASICGKEKRRFVAEVRDMVCGVGDLDAVEKNSNS